MLGGRRGVVDRACPRGFGALSHCSEARWHTSRRLAAVGRPGADLEAGKLLKEAGLHAEVVGALLADLRERVGVS